ncbi:HDOD domain-containing protein [Alkalimarinus alittae]|uniref:HDOD domain-containing protein n=1 Tax=Alkalimarinus alittae TaxID=2961619 RepID=A0ABY6N7B9_9ALTE|nr:HDOD domain-containing protein [Alkalimarinus alittae]UZE97879.1 HDOD domain-containing protein [Alkalimarinus alittae]
MEKKGLAAWVERLDSEDGVVLTSVLAELNILTSSDETSASQLAEVILRDASLTTQVLKVANTVHFNPTGSPITTVSRSILAIGFNTIKSICITIKVLESILHGQPATRLYEIMADAIHAATQARNICIKMSADGKEEIFVATLLLHLAEMLVLSSGESEVAELYELYEEDSTDKERDRIAESVIGVSYKRLGLALVKSWRLGAVLQESLQPSSKMSHKAEAVLMGEEVSQVSKKGWDSAEMNALMKKISTFTGSSIKDVESMVQESANEAAEVAANYGSDVLVAMIPSTRPVEMESDACVGVKSVHQPNQELQLKILQELTSMMMDGVDMNSLFQMVLEGLHRGVGLERVCLAIFDKGRETVSAKYMIGEGTENWREKFKFTFVKSRSGFLFQLFSKGKASWVGNENFKELTSTLTPDYIAVTGVKTFLIAPIKANKKPVGFLYADLGESKRALNDSYFNGFKHFCAQINMSLAVLANKNGS